MSVRRTPPQSYTHAHQLKTDLEFLRAAHLRNQSIDAAANKQPTLDDLNETERRAATLGVSPDALKPIGWMNTGHYNELLQKNVLSGGLAQQIEAFKVVSDIDAATRVH